MMAGSIFDRLLGRLRTAGEPASGNTDLPTGKLSAYFNAIAKVDRGLPAAGVRYVIDGDNTSVILTLQQGKT
jgi:hypothetical protein